GPAQKDLPPAKAAQLGPAKQGAGTVLTTTFRTGDRFTTRHQEGSLIITVTGTVADGKARASEINIQDGAVTSKYDSVDRVPAQERDKADHLLRVSGGVRVESRKA